MIVFAADRPQLTAALERADGDDHLDEETFDSGLEGLPEKALARVYVDVEAALEGTRGRPTPARSSGSARCGSSATVNAHEGGIEVDFRSGPRVT